MTLLAGQTSVNFSATPVKNTIINFTQNATVTASVDNWTSGSASVAIADDNNFITVSLPSGGWEGQTLANAGRITIGGTLSSPLVVNLASDNASLLLPSTVTIPAGQTTTTFNLTFQSDSVKNGDRTADITATATGLTTGASSLTIRDSTLDHLVISPITGPQSETVPFGVTISAYNIANEVISVYSGSGALAAAGQTGSLPVSPTPISFSSGVWTGNVTIASLDSAAQITATTGGISATSNTFVIQAGPVAQIHLGRVAAHRGDRLSVQHHHHGPRRSWQYEQLQRLSERHGSHPDDSVAKHVGQPHIAKHCLRHCDPGLCLHADVEYPSHRGQKFFRHEGVDLDGLGHTGGEPSGFRCTGELDSHASEHARHAARRHNLPRRRFYERILGLLGNKHRDFTLICHPRKSIRVSRRCLSRRAQLVELYAGGSRIECSRVCVNSGVANVSDVHQRRLDRQHHRAAARCQCAFAGRRQFRASR